MSRSGYTDDCENLGLWRAAVSRAIQGRRGQAFLREMADALDAMPVKELVADAIVRDKEHVCAMGCVAVARGLDVSAIDVTDRHAVSETLGIAPAMAAEIAYENDEHRRYDYEGHRFVEETDAQRWTRMRQWVAEALLPTEPTR